MALHNITVVIPIGRKTASNRWMNDNFGRSWADSFSNELGADFRTPATHCWATFWVDDAQLAAVKAAFPSPSVVSERGVDDSSPESVFRRRSLKRTNFDTSERFKEDV